MSRPLAIIAVGMVVLLVAAIQGQRHLKAVKKELGRTNEQVVKLEKVIGNLKTELDAVSKARTQLEAQLKEKEAQAQELMTEL
jgi:chromosome segregation ATPase